MGDSATIIIAIFLAAVLMFVVPLMTMADKQDDASTLAVQTATTEFTDKIRVTGKITQEDYDNYILTLAATGNAFDVDMTVQVLDENPKKKNTATITIDGNVYYIMYDTQVLQNLPLSLKEGDIVTVKAVNKNETIAMQFRNFLYKVTGNSSKTITAEDSVMVTTTAN